MIQIAIVIPDAAPVVVDIAVVVTQIAAIILNIRLIALRSSPVSSYSGKTSIAVTVA